jgi:hypothetical protein
MLGTGHKKSLKLGKVGSSKKLSEIKKFVKIQFYVI